MLTHGNIASNVTTCVELFDFREGDECLSFLPLSHIFERMFGHYSMFHAGVVINYAGGIDTVPADMQELPAHHDGLGAEAVREDLRAGCSTASGPVPRPAGGSSPGPGGWARAWVERTLAGAPIPPGLALQRRLADRLVFAKLRARTGGRIRFFISGGAPLSADIAKFFFAAGHADPRGVRSDRDLPGHGGEHLRPDQARHRRAGRSRASRCGSRRTARSSPAAPT